MAVAGALTRGNSEAVDPVTKSEGWTAAADKYKDSVGRATKHAAKRLVEIVGQSKPFDASSYVLDVGAGTGALALRVHEVSSSTKVLATDIAGGMLAHIDGHGISAISTQLADARDLSGLADNTFSHGLSSFAIQFTGDAQACVQSLYRVIEPGGAVGVVIWGPTVDAFAVHDKACYRIDPNYTPKTLHTPDAWRSEADHRRALDLAGFAETGTEMIHLPMEYSNLQHVLDVWFRSDNPAPGSLVAHWEAHGGSSEELEREYESVVREEYDSGDAMYAEAVLGWGRKGGGTAATQSTRNK